VGHHLAPSQRLFLRNLDNSKEAACRVVGQVDSKAGGRVYGIAFLDPNPTFWGIQFRPLQESERAAGQIWLKCGGCQRSDVVYLDEVEVLVFKANSCLSRHCQGCGKMTIWKRAEQEMPWNQLTASVPSLPLRTREERKAMRVKARLAACIRHRDFGEEVTWTVDVSRTGLRFRSARHYPQGLLIQLALFYCPTGTNIFCPARIVRASQSAGESNHEYGVAYLAVHKGRPGSQTTKTQ
jgi:hypothetical protein